MKRALTVLAAAFSALSIAVIAALTYYFVVTADARLFPDKLALSDGCVTVLDAEGELIKEVSAVSERETIAFAKMPQYLPRAFVAVEDKNFFSHDGFDFRRIAKAAMKNLASLSFREGASTISQQLVKNTHLSGEKTIRRKLREFKLTRALERKYSKVEILELYLNSIYFGHNCFGIGNASRFYFGKAAEDVTPAESAMLAALVRSPNRYSPFRNAESCLARRNFVLKLMREQQFLSEREYTDALGEPLPDTPHKQTGGNAYLSRVFDELAELFPDAEAGDLRDVTVRTCFCPDLQRQLETLAARCDSDYCLLVRDNRTDGITALASSVGTPLRQPASLVKPLLVYAPALEEGLISPATPVLDEKTSFGEYSPSNYGGGYGGYMSARYALTHSVNVPAVKILNSLTCEKGARYLEKMGLHVCREDYSLALALGGMKRGFTLPALADAYATFAQAGEYAPSSAVREVIGADGKTLYRACPQKGRVFSEDVAYLMNDMLAEAARSGTAKKLNLLPFPVCAKTGTNGTANGNTDAYLVSYTSEDTVAVWLGNADNSPVAATGGGKPADLALEVNRALYRTRAPEPLFSCDGVCEVELDAEEYEKNHRILLADPASPAALRIKELFRASCLPTAASDRFTRPTIQNPSVFVTNSSVCIELCQTEYYEYIVKRENKGKTVEIYRGKYRSKIYDNSVNAGERYTYTIIPIYGEAQGSPVILPSVYIPRKEAQEFPDWWTE